MSKTATLQTVRSPLLAFSATLFAIGTIGDVATTHIGISQMGLTESTPFVASAIAQYGLLEGLVLTKLLALFILGSLIAVSHGYRVVVAIPALSAYGLVYLIASINNLALITAV